jgi:hypothetical protein
VGSLSPQHGVSSGCGWRNGLQLWKVAANILERFNFKKLNEVEGKEQYRVEVSNTHTLRGFAAFEDFDAEVEINSAWEMIRENIKISVKESQVYYEMKTHKPWFDQACSKLADQRKQAKLQWLQDPSEINGDNLNNVRLIFQEQKKGISE